MGMSKAGKIAVLLNILQIPENIRKDAWGRGKVSALQRNLSNEQYCRIGNLIEFKCKLTEFVILDFSKLFFYSENR